MNEFRKAVEARDIDRAVECLADDIVFHSPVLFKPFVGKQAAHAVLSAAIATFEDFRYVGEMEGDEWTGLLFAARVGDKQIEGIDLLRLNEHGKIAEFTVMLRPMQAVTEFASRMASNAGLAAAAKAR
ncbi:MAG: nuclear transport factor 2 family protein [Actinomycetota bacterium]